jgi:hypothetical protein
MYWGYCMSCFAIYNVVSYSNKLLGYITYTKKWINRFKRCFGCFNSSEHESNISLDEIYKPLNAETNSYYFRLHEQGASAKKGYNPIPSDSESDSDSDNNKNVSIPIDRVETYYTENSHYYDPDSVATQSLFERFHNRESHSVDINVLYDEHREQEEYENYVNNRMRGYRNPLMQLDDTIIYRIE